ncbi:MAG TPA: hypothetical protein VFL47_07030 [Flavisolibacter sp.]|nr:hypothetical protein [Flavisolibacter sp.]
MQDFAELPGFQQTKLLYEQGVYIGKRRQETTIVVLFQLQGFYAEVFYRVYRMAIDRIDCFSDTDRLDPYLATIDLEPLMI